MSSADLARLPVIVNFADNSDIVVESGDSYIKKQRMENIRCDKRLEKMISKKIKIPILFLDSYIPFSLSAFYNLCKESFIILSAIQQFRWKETNFFYI